jgi:hypothetical protein
VAYTVERRRLHTKQVRNSEKKILLRTGKYPILEKMLKMDSQEIGLDVDWFHLAQDRGLPNTVIKLHVS